MKISIKFLTATWVTLLLMLTFVVVCYGLPLKEEAKTFQILMLITLSIAIVIALLLNLFRALIAESQQDKQYSWIASTVIGLFIIICGTYLHVNASLPKWIDYPFQTLISAAVGTMFWGVIFEKIEANSKRRRTGFE